VLDDAPFSMVITTAISSESCETSIATVLGRRVAATNVSNAHGRWAPGALPPPPHLTHVKPLARTLTPALAVLMAAGPLGACGGSVPDLDAGAHTTTMPLGRSSRRTLIVTRATTNASAAPTAPSVRPRVKPLDRAWS